MTNALIKYTNHGSSYTGTGNYITTLRSSRSLTLLQLEEAVFPDLFEEINKANEVSVLSSSATEPKSDLPLASDFGEKIDPQGLIYARLEGLQYYNR